MIWRERTAEFRHYANEKMHALKQNRARRQLTMRSILAVLAGYGMLTAGSHAGEIEFVEVVLGCIAVPAALGAVSAGRRFLRLNLPRKLHGDEHNPDPLPFSSPPPMPSWGSLARRPMRQLTSAEIQLSQLLHQLRQQLGSAAAVAETHVRASADDSASALRVIAERLIRVEKTRDTAPASARKDLDERARELSRQLDTGVEGYLQLVAAASRAVADAAVTGAAGSAEVQRMLNDAIDHLDGLASALRDLDGGPNPQGTL